MILIRQFPVEARFERANSGLGIAFSTVKTTGETPVPQSCHGLVAPPRLLAADERDCGPISPRIAGGVAIDRAIH